MLNIGDKAPDFQLHDHQGRQRTLADFCSHGTVLLFFYPADFTPVCTKQVCMVRDHYEALREAGVQVVGIAGQSEKRHEQFARRHELPYPLLADPGRRVAEEYGAISLFGLMPRRVSYLIDTEQRIIDRAIGDWSARAHEQLVERAISNETPGS
jgi:peroxiredoxin Q/BCP